MEINKSKNVITGGASIINSNVDNGDKITNIFSEEKREIPLILTHLPSISISGVIGRKQKLQELKEQSDCSDKIIVVQGLGGIGKTTFVKYFVEIYRSEYHHFAWIDAGKNIMEAFLQNTSLLDSLSLNNDIQKLDKNHGFSDNAFQLIINRLRQLRTSDKDDFNLLIIDNLSDEVEQKRLLEALALKPNWKVITTSRFTIDGVSPFTLSYLDLEDAMDLFSHHFTKENDKQLINDIVSRASLHTLTVELLAKTAQNHPGLSLKKLSSLLEKEGLDISKKVTIKMPNYDKGEVSTNITKCLNLAFDLSDFEENPLELFYLTCFSVLPPEDIPYTELKELFGVKYGNKDAEENEIDLLNSLANKGWLTKTQTGYKSHAVILDVIRRQQKPDYQTCFFLILNLTTKLKELNVQYSPELLKYLSFGQSILTYLDEARQPLFLLANEVFLGYHNLGFIDYSYDLRIEYLPVARESFNNDLSELRLCNFATYLSNLSQNAHELFRIDNQEACLDDALKYQFEAIKFYEQIENPTDDERRKIANGYDGLASLLYYSNDLEIIMPVVLKSLKYKNQYLKDDLFSLAITNNLVAKVYISTEEFEEAKIELIIAINRLKDITNSGAKKFRSQLYSNLASVFFALDELELAEKHEVQAIIEYSNSGFLESVNSTGYFEKVAQICIKKKDFSTALEYQKRAYSSYCRLLGEEHKFSIRAKKDLITIQDQI